MGWSPYRQTGLTHHMPASSVKGYTLVTPSGSDSAFLIDMAGRIVHRWLFTGIRPGYGRLLPNGNLLMRGVDVKVTPPVIQPGQVPTFEQAIRRMGANATHLVEVDWDSDVVWQYENPAIHHDFVRLANGNTLIAVTIGLPAEFARMVRGGRRTRERQPAMVADDIIEVDRDGREVRRIYLWQLLDPVRDPICPLESRREWTHLNGLDVTADGDVVFSCRQNSRVGIIASSGDRLPWKFGAPTTSHQHHPTVLPNGNVQIFDNGTHADGQLRSRVIEVNPKTDAIVWEYVADPPPQFFSSHISSAERLAGGNVLICEGASGRIFEVTAARELVWEWINPFASRVNGGLVTQVFRAHRYGLSHPALAGRDLDAERYRQLNAMYGL